MAVNLRFPSRAERLSAAERAFAEHLLKIAPNYEYERSGLPKLEPAPARGLASAIAAARMLSAHPKLGATG
jgi:hypothetical protein